MAGLNVFGLTKLFQFVTKNVMQFVRKKCAVLTLKNAKNYQKHFIIKLLALSLMIL